MERHTLIRIYQIDELIRSKQYPNCRELAERFEVSERTILRDIEAMKDSLGAAIGFSKEHNGYYYEKQGFCLPSLKLSEGELLAILLGGELIAKYKNTPFEAAIKKAFEKLQALLPETISINLNNRDKFISFDLCQTRELSKPATQAFELLIKAINDKTSVAINYYSIGRNKTQKRIIDPYHLRHTQGAWYLVGYCQLRKEVRTFAVNQIKNIKIMPKTFLIQKSFSAKKFFADSWGFEQGGPMTKVVVKLDKRISRWFIDRKLHPSQKTAENKDGSLTLTFQVAGTEEIKRWILSQGADIMVLEPKRLKKGVRDEARRMTGFR
ncbi:hypothetical protein A2291_06005 [candidate division WOR-1 bacterium RIFOXYB2_FULL_42_35]|uniref:HTH deoR-type domain-containing protein n=1 Tax=candidate division WOR-1 bacterium RIFOXYC2_FULL_41_25 TaxID=1802586 RepID=A0A1F4TJX0_UNCSA|nr:MAG: hypothetical protein A2247_01665 [candidate division WOR-1 bacterium RIFOXYA2_FULL_41_14]OGC22278.1 MAG: hypothetical protein A2291_06005 [candidate division WOR-1 bacterium RIFOXYB2_FULL_42_35]OGC32897.1 MAG: hypothetical protein A2462_00680 [candidate division WOR-1 bacterium RIFOXYC2_FULL_41_25]